MFPPNGRPGRFFSRGGRVVARAGASVLFWGRFRAKKTRMSANRLGEDWLEGRASLGAAGGWTAEEMRLVADVGYALAEQGRHDEAVTIFEGLSALAPATAYFQSALGALWLRKNDPARAVEHLEAALSADPADVTALVNRGEAAMRLGDRDAARKHLLAALEFGPRAPHGTDAPALVRARALLTQLPYYEDPAES